MRNGLLGHAAVFAGDLQIENVLAFHSVDRLDRDIVERSAAAVQKHEKAVVGQRDQNSARQRAVPSRVFARKQRKRQFHVRVVVATDDASDFVAVAG